MECMHPSQIFLTLFRKRATAQRLAALGMLAMFIGQSACTPTQYTSTDVPVDHTLHGEQLAFCARTNTGKVDVMGLADGLPKPLNVTADFGLDPAAPAQDNAGCRFDADSTGGSVVAPLGLRWSPDGAQLAFVLGLANDKLNSYVALAEVRPDASGATTRIWQQPFQAVGQYFGLNWSPNGQRIALVAAQTQSLEQGTGVYVGDISKTELQPLAQQDGYTQGIADPPPVWSPDGGAIAFQLGTSVLNSSAGRGIGIIEVTANTAKLIDDSTDKQMAMGAGGNYLARGKGLVWSPDSQTIFFIAAASSCGCPSMFRIQRDGTGLTLLRESVVEIALSPISGNIAAVQITRDAVQLVLIDRDGKTVHTVLTWPQQTPTKQRTYVADLAWSTKSEQLAFASNIHGDYDLYAVNADSGGLVNLTGWRGDEAGPQWRPMK